MSLTLLKHTVYLIFTICISITLSFFLSTHISQLFARQSVQVATSQQEADPQTIQILAAMTYPTPTPLPVRIPTQIPTPTITPQITPLLKALPKSSYIVAFFGDSMIDTMGNFPYLIQALHQKYPGTAFHVYNYGIGAQNVEQGLNRFDSPYQYNERNYPSIANLHPDVIVLGSYSYNPFSPNDPNKHNVLLTQLIQRAQATGASVYVLIEIAPLSTDFAKGPNGVQEWSDEERTQHASIIAGQLQDSIQVANSLHVPYIDMYDKTRSNGIFGSKSYTNTTDGIHPSAYGHELTQQAIAQTLHFN